jgi:excisionase family DNA binding protein
MKLGSKLVHQVRVNEMKRQPLGKPEHEFLAVAQAAERLRVSKTTVKQWLKRGSLTGYQWNGRWRIAPSDVEHIIRLRAALRDIELEGYPTQEEILALYSRSGCSSEIERLAASEP